VEHPQRRAGSWWAAPLLAGYPNYNALTPQQLQCLEPGDLKFFELKCPIHPISILLISCLHRPEEHIGFRRELSSAITCDHLRAPPLLLEA
jgi:hypothetical protein